MQDENLIAKIQLPSRRASNGEVETSPYSRHALLVFKPEYCTDHKYIPQNYIRREDIEYWKRWIKDLMIVWSDDKKITTGAEGLTL